MAYNKADIDQEAENEAKALRRQGRRSNTNESRTRQSADYNKESFEKLFAIH